MKTIIYDCDNTMGVRQRDIDDGLTIFYLIGNRDVTLKGITTTFGNDTIDVVYHSTKNLLEDIQHDGIPLVKGGVPDNRKSKAAQFLAEMVDAHEREITILATGALTNLYGAYLMDNDFFKKVKEIIVMGGITEPLIINGEDLEELNFSIDPEVAYSVLSSIAPTTVITGNLCLNALFGSVEINRLKADINLPAYDYIYKRVVPWVDFMYEIFKLDGFYNWDIVGGVYATHPGLFMSHHLLINSTALDLNTGVLNISTQKNNGYRLTIPSEITDIQKLNDIVFESWKQVIINKPVPHSAL